MDMLFYNSVVFATEGFARELLRCSRGVRDIVLVGVGIAEASNVSEIQALALPPKLLEEMLGSNDVQSKVRGTSTLHDLPQPSTDSTVKALEDAEVLQLVLSIVGCDRVGLIHDVVRTIFEHGGTVSASRMAQLDSDLAFLMQVTAPKATAMTLEEDVRRVVKGLQVSTKVSRDVAWEPPPYQAEVCCIGQKDTPGLLMNLMSVLNDFGLIILTLDTALRPTLAGLGFLMLARIGASAPIEEALLCERLDCIQEGVSISVTCFRTHRSVHI
jgi:glycine cleavage system regulatory protein